MGNRKDYIYFLKIIEQCYKTQNRHFIPVPQEELSSNLNIIDKYTDVVLETFLSEGLREDDEPNEYGQELQDVINYLLELRYVIVD